MAWIFRWDNILGGSVLVVDENGAPVDGDPLVSDLILALHTDAPPDVGDPVPEGVTRPGNWAADFDPSAPRGSKLWMLRYVKPVEKAILHAEIWTEEALAPFVTAKRLKSVSASASLNGKRISIRITVILPDAKARTFVLDAAYRD